VVWCGIALRLDYEDPVVPQRTRRAPYDPDSALLQGRGARAGVGEQAEYAEPHAFQSGAERCSH